MASRANSRSKIQRERDLELTAELYLKGWTQRRIAERIGVSRQQITYDLRKLYDLWRESAVRNFDEHRARELAAVTHLEATYWAAWEKSEARSVEGKTADGDPRYLQGVERCIERRCKLLGLDAPDKIEIQDKTLEVIPPPPPDDAEDND